MCSQGWGWISTLMLYKILRLVFSPQTILFQCASSLNAFPFPPQTYIGNMLLSINPFKPLNIYTEELREKYQGKEQQRNPPWANASHTAVHFSAFSYSLLQLAACVSPKISVPSEHTSPSCFSSLVIVSVFSLPQPCVCHSRHCFQSLSSFHNGAVHHHKVLTRTLISNSFTGGSVNWSEKILH